MASSTIRDCSTTLAHFTNHSDTICAALSPMTAGLFRESRSPRASEMRPRHNSESAGASGRRLAWPSGTRDAARASRDPRDSSRSREVLHHPRKLTETCHARCQLRAPRPRFELCWFFRGKSDMQILLYESIFGQIYRDDPKCPYPDSNYLFSMSTTEHFCSYPDGRSTKPSRSSWKIQHDNVASRHVESPLVRIIVDAYRP